MGGALGHLGRQRMERLELPLGREKSGIEAIVGALPGAGPATGAAV
jgi:hypothetical protein